jgi:hypothetical protein
MYAVPYVGFVSMAKVGAVVAALVTVLPCLVFAYLGASFVHWMRTTLDFWVRQEARVPIINVGLPLNFVTLLQLQGVHDRVIYWDDRLALLFVLMWVVPWGVCILGGALFAWLVGLVYNMTASVSGGIRVRLDAQH